MNKVMDSKGETVDVVPIGAKCAVTGEYLDEMERCPRCNFDDDGDVCVPDLCDEYYEVE